MTIKEKYEKRIKEIMQERAEEMRRIMREQEQKQNADKEKEGENR